MIGSLLSRSSHVWEVNITIMEYKSAVLQDHPKGMKSQALLGVLGGSFTQKVRF